MSLDLARKQDEDGSRSAAHMAAHYMGNWGRNQNTNTTGNLHGRENMRLTRTFFEEDDQDKCC